MLKLLLKIFNLLNKESEPSSSSTPQSDEFSENLDTACTMMAIYMREDGEFAITSEFFNNSEDAVEISGIILHMLNSGLLADYFLKSLYLWGEQNEEQQAFVVQIVKKWKDRFDAGNTDSMGMAHANSVDGHYKLAVDPTEVFSLKSFSQQKDFE